MTTHLFHRPRILKTHHPFPPDLSIAAAIAIPHPPPTLQGVDNETADVLTGISEDIAKICLALKKLDPSYDLSQATRDDGGAGTREARDPPGLGIHEGYQGSQGSGMHLVVMAPGR